MNVIFSPIGPWPLVALAALAITVLTLWGYRPRIQGGSGKGRFLVLGLRLLALLMCLFAALRPSVILAQKRPQPASMIFLVDASTSMQLSDQVGGRSRWATAREALEQARKFAKEKLPANIEAKFYRFGGALADSPAAGEALKPDQRETALGTAILEARKRQAGTRVAWVVVLSDGANNAGPAPLAAAEQLKREQVPVVAVGIGEETAGPESKDIAVRELVAGPTVFEKNELQARATISARGFAGETLEAELYAEDQPTPVAVAKVKVPANAQTIPIPDLKYVPQTAGEKRLTLKVKVRDGELVRTNNEITSYVTVLKGGLAVLYIQGPNFTWDARFLPRALDASPDIQADFLLVTRPAQGARGQIDDAVFAPGRYDVFVLGGLSADMLTVAQQRKLAAAVRNGAGVMMLGGRSSFGAGGWGNSQMAPVLPVTMSPADGQIEPESGVKFQPNLNGLESYILQLGSDRARTAKIWSEVPNLPGANRMGRPKDAALILATTPERLPLLVSQDIGNGRSLAFAGETWVWARQSEDSRLAHRKFWRQAILWLAHKEDTGEQQVRLALDRRRLAAGQRLEMGVSARDPKGEPITDATYEVKVTRIPTDPNAEVSPAEPVDVFPAPQSTESRGAYYANGQAGEYRVTVTGTRKGQSLGTATARFVVYEDDRELENPAANLGLLRQMAELTGGAFLPPEQLVKHLRTFDPKVYTQSVSQVEHKLWDNWPFFLAFVTILTLEWIFRKRLGWV